MNYQLTSEQKHAVCAQILEHKDEGAIMVLLQQREFMEQQISAMSDDTDDLEEATKVLTDRVEHLEYILNDHGINGD